MMLAKPLFGKQQIKIDRKVLQVMILSSINYDIGANTNSY